MHAINVINLHPHSLKGPALRWIAKEKAPEGGTLALSVICTNHRAFYGFRAGTKLRISITLPKQHNGAWWKCRARAIGTSDGPITVRLSGRSMR